MTPQLPATLTGAAPGEGWLILKVALPRLARRLDRVDAWLDRYIPERFTEAAHELRGLGGAEGLVLLAAVPPDRRAAALEQVELDDEDRLGLCRLADRLGDPTDERSLAAGLVRMLPSVQAASLEILGDDPRNAAALIAHGWEAFDRRNRPQLASVFRPPRDRDAFASIRGYIFQIDLTIDRWLSLGADQSLDLERGEDIDLVSRLLSTDGSAEEARLLEQIKHRETSITLRTAAALEALANFHDHRLNNANINLRFCFLTNAAAGREQLSPFANGMPGIILWEHIRTGQLDANDLPAAVTQLQRFLLNLPRPNGFPESVWGAWIAYLRTASVEELRAYIDRFEWSTGQPNAEQLPSGLPSRVLSLGLATDEIEAGAVCDRMFVYVARLLTKAGSKRLTVEDQTSLLAQPTLPAADREVLKQLREIVARHTSRLDRLEMDVSAIGARVEGLYVGRTSGERIEVTAPVPDLSLPQPVARLSPRPEAVQNLFRLLKTRGWVSLHGGPDVGKSQLVIQLAIAHRGRRSWVRFHHSQTLSDAGRLLDAALAALAGWNNAPHRAGWYSEAVPLIGSGSLVVLDDLPRVVGDDPFAEQLSQFGLAARAAGLRIASTSQFELPVRFRHQLGDTWLHDRPAPMFTDEEARGLLLAYGAPESFFENRRVQFLNVHAAGHPLLLGATAEFLAGRNWRFQENEIEALLRGDHTERVLPEVIDRLTRTIDDSPRELLYRLTLPIGSFEHAHLAVLANVRPPIDRPRERLNELLGPWVQRDTDTEFAVSPLVKALGRTELAPDVRARCYRELAVSITSKRVMNQYEGERAILYNLEAGEFGRALTLYVLSLFAAIKQKEAKHILRIIDMWRQSLLPVELSIGEQLFVRAYQLAAFTKFKLDTQFIIGDIDRLLEQATERDGYAIVALAVQNIGESRSQDPSRVLKYIRRAVELGKIYGPDGDEIVFDDIYIPDMLWTVVTELRTPALQNQWFDTVEALPPGERQRFWSTELARQAVWLVPNKLYTTEWEKPKSEQDWDSVLRTLSSLRDRAQRLNQPLLEGVLTGLMLDIQGDRKRFDDLPAIAEPTLARWPNEPDVQFEVRGTWGRQYAHHHRPDLALPLLDAALSQAHSQNDHERLRCLLAANLCLGEQDLRYAEQARNLARSSRQAPPIEAARALGEYALSLFQLQGGQAGAIAAFSAWAEAFRQFLGVPNKDKLWRDLFVLFAHATGYLAQLARFGSPPDRTIEGEPWVAPSRGFLLKEYMPRREKLYRAGGEASVSWMMHEYAAATSATEGATYWMKRAMEESRRAGAVFIQAITSIDAAAELLINGSYEDAIEAGIMAGRGIAVHRAIEALTRENFDGLGIDLAAEFQKLPINKREQGDYFSLMTVLIPAAMCIVRLSLTDPDAAASAGRRVSAACRQLSDDEWGDRQLWGIAAEFFELSSKELANAEQILARVRAIRSEDERRTGLGVLGYLLATWHASPEEAIHYQLACISFLLEWVKNREVVHRLILMPYVESFWQRAAKESRFAFRSPDLAVAAIEAAVRVPEAKRVQAILMAAASGFRIRGLQDVLHTLQGLIPAS
jgi:hypothetical protein